MWNRPRASPLPVPSAEARSTSPGASVLTEPSGASLTAMPTVGGDSEAGTRQVDHATDATSTRPATRPAMRAPVGVLEEVMASVGRAVDSPDYWLRASQTSRWRFVVCPLARSLFWTVSVTR